MFRSIRQNIISCSVCVCVCVYIVIRIDQGQNTTYRNFVIICDSIHFHHSQSSSIFKVLHGAFKSRRQYIHTLVNSNIIQYHRINFISTKTHTHTHNCIIYNTAKEEHVCVCVQIFGAGHFKRPCEITRDNGSSSSAPNDIIQDISLSRYYFARSIPNKK